MNGKASQWVEVESEVRQGSVLWQVIIINLIRHEENQYRNKKQHKNQKCNRYNNQNTALCIGPIQVSDTFPIGL